MREAEMVEVKRGQKSIPWRLRSSDRRVLLIVGDFAAAVLATLLALYAWGQRDWLDFSLNFITFRVPIWFYALPFLWVFLMAELYDVHRANRIKLTLWGIFKGAGILFIIYLLIFFTLKGVSPRRSVAYFIIGVSTLTLVWRMIYIHTFNAPDFMRRFLIVGAGTSGQALVNVIADIWPPPFYVVGLIDDDPDKLNLQIGGYRVIGNGSHLLDIIQKENISDLAIAISGDIEGDLFQAVLDAQEQGVEVSTMPMVYEELLSRVPIFHLDADWLLRSFGAQIHANGFYEVGKRILDLICGLGGVCLGIIVFPLVTLAILIDSGKPVFYSQSRLGKGGQHFKIYKFRTMRVDSEKDGKVRVTIENDDRITRVGRFLRKSRLDESPQILNVLRGDMSMVGPRAERTELVNNLQSQIPFYRARLLVKPGLTGWAQVNFGYAATVEDTAIKLEYDLYYIKHRNLILDLLILLRTVGVVVGLKGQ